MTFRRFCQKLSLLCSWGPENSCWLRTTVPCDFNFNWAFPVLPPVPEALNSPSRLSACVQLPSAGHSVGPQAQSLAARHSVTPAVTAPRAQSGDRRLTHWHQRGPELPPCVKFVCSGAVLKPLLWGLSRHSQLPVTSHVLFVFCRLQKALKNW